MAGVNIIRKLATGLLMAVVLIAVYLAISLTDLWGYLPSLVQAVVYGLLLSGIVIFVAISLRGKNIWSSALALKMLGLSVVLLLIAGILAGSDSARLIEIALKPRAIFSYPVPDIVMTVTPPSYSNREKFSENMTFGMENQRGLNPVMEGSKVVIRMTNIAYAPTLIAGSQRLKFHADGVLGFSTRFTVENESRWQIREGGRIIGQWSIVRLEDDPPVINRADYHNMKTGDGLFGLSLDISDDYGVQKVVVGVVSPGSDANILRDRTRLALTAVKGFSGETYVNLSASSLAGDKVDLVVEVIDQAGQKSQKIISAVRLPARKFSNGIARKIIAIRDKLVKQPDRRQELARQLVALGLVPDNGQMPDIYYLALRSAYWRLSFSKDDSNINDVRDILWNLAGRLEDGGRDAFGRKIRFLLATLKVMLVQRRDQTALRKQLQAIDQSLVLFRRNRTVSLLNRYQPEKYDVMALRSIYGRILSDSGHKKFAAAVELVSYLEHGFIYNDAVILSGQGFARFETAHYARKVVNLLQKTQKRVMSFVMRKTVRLDFPLGKVTSRKATGGKAINDPGSLRNGKIDNWIDIQKNLGEKVNDLGRSLQKSGIDAARFTVPAGELAREVIHSMTDGDMPAAVGYQNQIMTLLQNLKNMLDRDMRHHLKGVRVDGL